MRRAPIALALLLLAGCTDGGRVGPPEILYGVDVCDHCRMVISEERHAAAARPGEGERRFDDPGCMIDYLGAQAGAPIAAWVHDESAAWLPIEEAWFVEDPDGGTPMASGILAFGSREAAAGAAERYASEPRSWAALLAAAAERSVD